MLVIATAITFWVFASLMRVVAAASPLSGVKWKIDHFRIGVALGEDSDRLDMSSSVMALSTDTEIGTVLPFSAISGAPSVIFPDLRLLAAGESLQRLLSSSGAASASDGRKASYRERAPPSDRTAPGVC